MRLPTLHIALHGKPIAKLIQLQGDRNLFVFEQSYLDDRERATLSLSFHTKTGEVLNQFKPMQTRLMPFLSNLLPEGAMRHYLAQQAGIKPEREFYLLAALGQDLAGAITVSAEQELAWQGQAKEIQLVEPEQANLSMMRFSLAGIQIKFSALPNLQSSLTVPTKGVGGSWIVKLPDTRFSGVPENEYAFMRLAARLGITVPDIQLLPLEQIQGLPTALQDQGKLAFVIRRFDRDAQGKAIHIEDFAQIFAVYPERKYEAANYRSLARLIWDVVGEKGLVEFIHRLTFNLLIGNGDMHLKNWSLIYPDERTAQLAPAYDFLSTVPYLKNDTLALKFVDSKAFQIVSRAEFQRFAQKAKLPERLILDAVDELLAAFVWQWRDKEQWGLAPNVATALEQHLQQLPLWAER